jgi:DNA adenine methylase
MIKELLALHRTSGSELKGRAHFKQAGDTLRDPASTDMQLAVGLYIRNRLAFSGNPSGHFSPASWLRWLDSEHRIRNLASWTPRLQGWLITSMDYSEVIAAPFQGKAGLIFADPPYDIEASRLYGTDGEMHRGFDHARFKLAAADANCNIMVTYNAELHDDFNEWPTCKLWKLGYSMISKGRYKFEERSRHELLALNFTRSIRNTVSIRRLGLRMEPEEIRATFERLGMNQQQAAKVLGVSDRAVRYWLTGEREISGAAAEMLKLLQSNLRRRSPNVEPRRAAE